MPVTAAVNNSFGFGGHNASLRVPQGLSQSTRQLRIDRRRRASAGRDATRAIRSCGSSSCSTPARSSCCARATTAACSPRAGAINGAPAIAFCTDATMMGGAMGSAGCRHIVDAIDTAVRERVPVIGLWHSGGARLAEGVEALHAVGLVFQAMIRASGRVPQISVVLGPAAGGAAYGPALTDVVIMSTAAGCSSPAPTSSARSPARTSTWSRSAARTRTAGAAASCTSSPTTEAEAIAPRPSVDLAARPAGHLRPATSWARTQDLGALLPDNPQARLRRAPARSTAILDDGHVPRAARASGRRTSSPASAGSPAAPSASSPTTRCASAAAWTRRRRRRPPASCGCATRSACRSSCSSTCPATCPASARSGTASCAAAPSCCTPSARRSCRG